MLNEDIEALGAKIREALIQNGLPRETTIYGMSGNYYGRLDIEAAISSLNDFLRCHGYHVEIVDGQVNTSKNDRYSNV